MTRWGIMADIHGNVPALERATAEFERRGVERIAVLGDNLGRGDSDGCVRLVRSLTDVAVVGNRDLDWQDRVSNDAAAYVRSLPRVLTREGIAFSHGDARLTPMLATDGARDGFRKARRWLAEQRCSVWFFGHSHRARVWTITSPDGDAVLRFDAATDALPSRVELQSADQPEAILIVNAGSVGLPFGGKGPASALVFDSAARTLDLFAI